VLVGELATGRRAPLQGTFIFHLSMHMLRIVSVGKLLADGNRVS
jgi:hypothetical protein